MPEITKCSECGFEYIPQSSLKRLCPSCLIRGVAEESELELPADLSSPSGRFVAPTVEQIQATFPQLEIVSLLACGGMSSIYKAIQKPIHRQVVLKILPQEIAKSTGGTDRFLREARILGMLNHPQLVTLYDAGQCGPWSYLITELVNGPNLRQLTRESCLTIDELLQLLPQICDGLQYIHDQGIVHCDMKPENILFDQSGRVRIIDFGLARVSASSEVRTVASTQVMGTPPYMAPEQLERPSEIDCRTDLYSIGVMTYEMLTGQLPPEKTDAADLKTCGDVRLDAIIRKLLNRERVRRYQTARDLRNDLMSILPGIASSQHQPLSDTVTIPAVRTTTSIAQLLFRFAIFTVAVTAFVAVALSPSGSQLLALVAIMSVFMTPSLVSLLRPANTMNSLAAQPATMSGLQSMPTRSQGVPPMKNKKSLGIRIAQAALLLLIGAIISIPYWGKTFFAAKARLPENLTFHEAAELGTAAFERRDYDQAIVAWDRAIQLGSENSEIHRWRGDASLNKRQFDKALSEYDEAIRIDANNGYAYLSRGVVWMMMQDPLKALAAFDDAIQLEPKIINDSFYKRNVADARSLLLNSRTLTFSEATKVGLSAFKSADYDQAMIAFDKAIKLNPNDSEVHRWHGDTWLNKNMYGKALADYDEAIRLDPRNAWAYVGRGAAWTLRREPEQATAAFEEAIRIDPTIAETPFYQRYSVAAQKLLPKQKKPTLVSAEEKPAFAEVSQRGLDAFEKRDFDQAIVAFDEAIQLDPKHSEVHRWRGDASLNKDELDKALAEYDEAVKLDPGNAMAHLCRGIVFTRKRDRDHAISALDESIRLDPKIADLLIYKLNASAAQSISISVKVEKNAILFADAAKRGADAFERGKFDQAIVAWDEAIQLDPTHSEVHRWRGDASLNKREFDKAMTEYDEAIRLDPQNGMAHFCRGIVWTEKKQRDKAIAEFDEAVRLDPAVADFPGYSHYVSAAEALRTKTKSPTFNEVSKRGHEAFEKRDFDNAIVAFDEAIKIDPKHSEAHRWRGDASLNKRQFDKALAEYDEAIKLDPENATAHLCRGIVMTEKRDPDQAIASFDEAVRLEPKFADLPVLKIYKTAVNSLRPDSKNSTTSRSRINEKTFRKQVDALVQPYLDNKIIVGMTIGVSRNGQRVILGYGHLSHSDLRVPDGDTIYELGSITKVLTGLLLADSVVQGQSRLDQPAVELLPEGVALPSFSGRQITLQDLSTHASGLPKIPDNMKPFDPYNPYAKYTIEEMYSFLKTCELTRAPGEKIEYSNLAQGLLGHLLALKSKSNYEKLVQDRIATPLKMTSTRISLDDELKARFATPHMADGQPTSPWDCPTLAGCGAVRSSVSDMLRFAEANLSPPKDKLGEAIELAWSIQQEPPKGNDSPNSLGWMVMPDESRWHGGQTGGFHTMMIVNRNTKTSLVIMTNTATMDVDQLAIDLTLVLAGQKVEPRTFEKPIEVPTEVLQTYIGKYKVTPDEKEGVAEFVEVKVVEGKLMLGGTDQPEMQVFARSKTEWFFKGFDVRITFNIGENGECNSVDILEEGKKQTAERIK